MRNVSDKNVDKTKTDTLCSTSLLQNRAVYEIMLKKYGKAKQATDGNITRRTRFA
jgi:hypothetical protein